MLTKNTKLKWRLTVAGLAAVTAAVVIPYADSSAKPGPDRAVYTMQNPADEVTFNSIIDNNVIGDERNFVRIAELGSGGETSDSVKVTPGKDYLVWIFFHNNAKSSLNESGKGMATGVRVRTGLSKWEVSKNNPATVTGVVSATNSNPLEVWDDATFTTDSEAPVVLRYLKGTAKIYNNEGKGDLNGASLPQSLFEDQGAYIGYNMFSGKLPGCEEYSGHIVYHIRAEQVGASISKTVSKDGVNFFETVDANPGDTLTYKVEFKNTGTMDLTNVGFHDKLPAGVTLINGTTTLVNNANPNGLKMKDIIGQNGFNTGLYGAGATATITYKVKLNDDIVANAKCGSKTAFVNKIFAVHDAGEIQDISTIYVSRYCEDTPPCKEGVDPECTPTVTGDCDENDIDCICKENPSDPRCGTVTTPPELPKTGPGEIALAIVAVVCIATGGIYWYRSQKDLAKVAGGLDKGSKASK